MFKLYPFLITALSLLISTKITVQDHILHTSLVVPSHYSLDFELDPAADTYKGYVSINFSAARALYDIIVLHASLETLEIQYALLNYQHNCNITDYDKESEIVTLSCPVRSFQVDNVLIVHFKGVFYTEDVKGLYKIIYNENEEDHALLATQLWTTAARRVFPCFDEPRWKATFDIHITHPNDYIALANTPAFRKFCVSTNQTLTTFETTPPMSTYLIAFAISKFVSNEKPEWLDYYFKVFSRPSTRNFTNIAASYGPLLIDLLSKWTGIQYADLGDNQIYQIAIPEVPDGAMENWGLIAYSEVNLLDDQENTSNLVKQKIITTMAHELAHQWFGDYVTLDWWSDAWLNEGFATYFEYYIPDQLDDELDTMKQFVVDILQPVLQTDAVPSALPLSSAVNSKAEYDAKFDEISYSKGASIIRMLRNCIGEDGFRKGLQFYLQSNKYNITNPAILLSSFTETRLELIKIMDEWIYKSGYPLLTAKLNGSLVNLSQEKFKLQNFSDLEETQWYIPITFTTSDERNFDIVVKGWLQPKFSFEIGVDTQWIILNIQQIGYYRVNYDDTLWNRIIKALYKEHTKIDVLNRAQLIDDVFNIARTGAVSYEIAFHVVDYLSFETEYFPWASAFKALSYISGKLDDDEGEKLLQSRILYWISKAFPKNEKMGPSHVDKLKEILILDWACWMGQEECTVYAQETFKDFKSNGSLPDYNKRGIVFCHGFRNSSSPSKDYKFLLNLFKSSTSISEKKDIILSLGCTKNTNLLSQFLSETIAAKSSMKSQDTSSVFKAVYSRNEVGVNVILDFLESNLKDSSAKSKLIKALPYLIVGIGNKMVTDNEINRLAKIIENNVDLKQIGDKAVEIAKANKEWSNKYTAEIKKILEEPPINRAHSPDLTLFLLVTAITMVYLIIVMNTKLE